MITVYTQIITLSSLVKMMNNNKKKAARNYSPDSPNAVKLCPHSGVVY